MTEKRAISITIAYRGWQLVSGLITIGVVTALYSPETQGFYFTFASLLAVQAIFELGITQVITTITAHQAAQSGWRADIATTLPSELAPALAAVFAFTSKRAKNLAIGFTAATTPIGFIVMQGEKSLPMTDWLLPWALVVSLSAARIAITIFEGFFEGLNQVSLVAKTRLFSSITASLVLWISIAAQLGLHAVALSIAASIMITLYIYKQKVSKLVKTLHTTRSMEDSSQIWSDSAKSYQKHMAISWIFGYIIFQSLVPMAFHFLGAVEAGRLGLALSLCGAITTIGSAWLSPRVPELARLSGQLNLAAVRGKARNILKEVTTVNLSLVVVVGAAYIIVSAVAPTLAIRFADDGTMFVLLIATVANQYVTTMATVSRAFGFDPYSWPTAVSACISVVASLSLTATFGTLGVAGAYLGSLLVSLLPFSLYRHYLLEGLRPAFYSAKLRQ